MDILYSIDPRVCQRLFTVSVYYILIWTFPPRATMRTIAFTIFEICQMSQMSSLFVRESRVCIIYGHGEVTIALVSFHTSTVPCPWDKKFYPSLSHHQCVVRIL